MSSGETAAAGGGDSRSSAEEIAAYYARRLRPKLAHAARRRVISAEAASELERQMRSMLRMR